MLNDRMSGYFTVVNFLKLLPFILQILIINGKSDDYLVFGKIVVIMVLFVYKCKKKRRLTALFDYVIIRY